jgi:mannose-1-phosphate guanylyltransferase
MVDTAVILAGGFGSRLNGLGYEVPRSLLSVKRKPVLVHLIKDLKKHGVNNIIISCNKNSNKIQKKLGDGNKLGVNISYSLEPVRLGTGGALKNAAKEIEEPFLILYGDNLMNVNYKEMMEMHFNNKTKVTMALTPREDVENYGVAKLDNDKVAFFVEKPSRLEAPSKLVNAGAFIIEPSILSRLPKGKSSIENDLFVDMACFGQISAYHHKGQWYPIDTIEKYQEAQKNFKPVK